jgi:predicted RND superfamily exporter protein
MVLSLAYSIYLLNAYNNNRSEKNIKESPENKKKIIACSFKDVWLPIFLSALTTGIGFCSLVVSDVTPVRDLGLYAALSIASAFVLVISFLPAALFLFPLPSLPIKSGNKRERFQGFSQTLSQLAIQRKHLILIFCLIIFLVSSGGITQLKVETHALKFFNEKSQLAQAYAFIEDKLTGLSPIEIVIESKKSQGNDMLLTKDTVEKIKSLQEFLSQQEEVICSQSVVNILEDEMRGLTLRTTDSAFQGYFNEKENAIRISVKAKTLGSSEYQLLINTINRYLDENFSNGMRAYTTGIVPLIVDMQDTVLKNLIESFSIAFGVIGVILFLLLRSLKNTLISMIPNILPIVVILGFMGWAGIKLDVATIMIASIALGIAVDDTIHFLFRFKREQSASVEYGQPICSTLSSSGKAIIFTSLVTFCGFFVLCFSDFRPMIYFGLLTGITIVAALIGDLIVLPASLVAFKVKLN